MLVLEANKGGGYFSLLDFHFDHLEGRKFFLQKNFGALKNPQKKK